jgi:methyl-accepting chemotaxis protein
MDTVTQQNAALVEQAAAAAASMQEQAENLSRVVSVFKLDQTSAPMAAPRPAPAAAKAPPPRLRHRQRRRPQLAQRSGQATPLRPTAARPRPPTAIGKSSEGLGELNALAALGRLHHVIERQHVRVLDLA